MALQTIRFGSFAGVKQGVSAGGIPLNNVYFTIFRIFISTICQFSRKGKSVESGFSAGEIPCFTSGFTRSLGKHRFFDNDFCHGRVLLQIQFQLIA